MDPIGRAGYTIWLALADVASANCPRHGLCRVSASPPENTDMVRIRLKRFGRTHHPEYRLCAMDARSPRDGRPIEELGYYHPCNKNEDEQVKLNTERIAYWLSVGAQPSETAASLIKKAGVELPGKKKK